MKWNLRNRILVPTAALILIITGTLTAVAYWMGKTALVESMDGRLDQICTSGLHQVESWMEGQRLNLIQWSTEPQALAGLQEAGEAAAVRSAFSSQLSHAKQLYGFYEDLVLADMSGATIACSSADQIGKLRVGDREYFKRAATGETVVSSVLQSRISGNPIVVIATPVKDGTVVRGVLYGILNLTWFSEKFVANIKVMETGYVFMFDEQGVFIAHANKAMILKAKLADYSWTGPIHQATSGKLTYVYDGIEKAARFRKSESLRWGLIATVPHSEMTAAATHMGWTSLALGFGALIAGIGLMFMTARSITRPILHASENLSAGAQQITSAAGQVSTASQTLAEGSSEQAASIEETSSSLEEINSMTKRNAEHAQSAKTLAQETRLAADHGTKQMDDMVVAMNAIKSSADNIAKIVKSIDEIAFQTNILALNAAVEAARAGEAGLGFAVVAEEVRALAQRAAHAARETSEKIEDSIQKSSAGVEISGKAAESLKLIATKAHAVDDLVAEIATASQEQAKGLSQINVAVSQMDKVTQSNAASAEETAAAAEELNAQAYATQESVNELTQLVEGGVDARSAGAASSSSASAKEHASSPGKVRSFAKPSTALPPRRNGMVRPTLVRSNGHDDLRFKDM